VSLHSSELALVKRTVSLCSPICLRRAFSSVLLTERGLWRSGECLKGILQVRVVMIIRVFITISVISSATDNKQAPGLSDVRIPHSGKVGSDQRYLNACVFRPRASHWGVSPRRVSAGADMAIGKSRLTTRRPCRSRSIL
jgi:hypothetical protein